MSKRESTLRYTFIIQKLRNHKYATFKEIADYLARQSEIQGYDLNVSQRTFQRDIQDIRSIQKIDIQYDFSRKVYFIATDEQDELNARMMESFDLLNALNVDERLSKAIFLEKSHRKGTENLHGLLHAIKNKLQIKFAYQKFWEDVPTQRTAEPYALKEFRNRWYVLALNIKDNTIKTFGLDRLTDLEILKKKFQLPKGFSASDYFKHAFDIEIPNDGKPQEVVLSFKPLKGKYIKTLPLHESQEILVDDKNEFRVKLDVYISYALKQEILSHGNEVKVIKPLSLIKEMKVELQSALNQYK
ncbi:MAG TPA: WYL domain-containing protein [Chitinophagales bacterium]